MNRRQNRILGVALALLLATAGIARAGETPLTFGIFPRWNAQISVRHFTPLAALLSRELGRPVHIETDKDFDSFMRRVYAREFDVVHLNQMQYLQAHRRAGYRVIAKTCDNPSCTIRAVIITRSDSRVTKIEDLRGRIIAFGDPGAMVSHILARSILSRSSLEPDQYKTIFTKNPPNALFAVYNGDADAAGVGSSVFQQPEILQRIDMRELRILAESRPIPHLPVAVRGDMDAGLARNLRQTLTGLSRRPDGRVILEKLGIERFEQASEEEYAAIGDLAGEKHGPR